MKLPNGHHAIVDHEKLVNYLLDPLHREGRHHAVLFRDLLGIGREQWPVLLEALYHHAEVGEALEGKRSPFGRKFEIRFPMTGPRGALTILSVWIIRKGEDVPRLVTAYVE